MILNSYPITTAADGTFKYFFCFIKSLNISWESSSKQTIHMKCEDLFTTIKAYDVHCFIIQ